MTCLQTVVMLFPQFVVEHINTVNRNLEYQYFFTDIVKRKELYALQ